MKKKGHYRMKNKKWLFSLIFLAGVMLSACQPDTPPATPASDLVIEQGKGVTVESLEVMILESFPVQVNAIVSGYFSDGCTTLEKIDVERETDQIFTINIVTRRPSGDVSCTMAIVPFEETVALDVAGLPAGEYTVKYKDLSETFTLDIDNVITE